jgi:PAS fold.
MFWKRTVTKAQEYAESIINTVREPLIVLDQNLRVVTVNRSFYDVFKVNPEETVGQLIYDWAINSGISPNCGNCWKTSCPKKQPLMTMRWNTIFLALADVPCF